MRFVWGIKRIAGVLRGVYHDGVDKDARRDMAQANAGLGVVHGLAVPHGMAANAPRCRIAITAFRHGTLRSDRKPAYSAERSKRGRQQRLGTRA
jgi:alcohol dehydrogenase class IV